MTKAKTTVYMVREASHSQKPSIVLKTWTPIFSMQILLPHLLLNVSQSTPSVQVRFQLTSTASPEIKDHPAFRPDPFSVFRSKPAVQRSVNVKPGFDLRIPPDSSSRSMTSSSAPNRNSRDVENVMVGLGLVDPKDMRSQPLVPYNIVNGAWLTPSPSSVATRQQLRPSPSHQTVLPRSCAIADFGGTSNPSATHSFGQKTTRNLSPSSGISQVDSRATSSKNATPVLLPYSYESFLDDESSEKRNHIFAHLHKSKSANKTSSKGEQAISKSSRSSETNCPIANVEPTNAENWRGNSLEKDRLRQV